MRFNVEIARFVFLNVYRSNFLSHCTNLKDWQTNFRILTKQGKPQDPTRKKSYGPTLIVEPLKVSKRKAKCL
jgi:hypothetical protein